MIEAPILDMAAVAEAKAMMKAKFPTMVQYYLEDAETYIGAIRDGIASASAANITLPAHTLKSSSRQMGAMRVSDIARTMETLARDLSDAAQADMRDFTELFVRLEAAFAATRTALIRTDG